MFLSAESPPASSPPKYLYSYEVTLFCGPASHSLLDTSLLCGLEPWASHTLECTLPLNQTHNSWAFKKWSFCLSFQSGGPAGVPGMQLTFEYTSGDLYPLLICLPPTSCLFVLLVRCTPMGTYFGYLEVFSGTQYFISALCLLLEIIHKAETVLRKPTVSC